MSDLIAGMKSAADVLADATIEAFWTRYDARMKESIEEAGQRIAPEVRLKSLIVHALYQSVQGGWVDPNSYAYTAFIHCDLLSVDPILDHLAEVVAENGVLTTTDLQFAHEMWRYIRQKRRQPPQKKSWFSWLVG